MQDKRRTFCASGLLRSRTLLPDLPPPIVISNWGSAQRAEAGQLLLIGRR